MVYVCIVVYAHTPIVTSHLQSPAHALLYRRRPANSPFQESPHENIHSPCRKQTDDLPAQRPCAIQTGSCRCASGNRQSGATLGALRHFRWDHCVLARVRGIELERPFWRRTESHDFYFWLITGAAMDFDERGVGDDQDQVTQWMISQTPTRAKPAAVWFRGTIVVYWLENDDWVAREFGRAGALTVTAELRQAIEADQNRMRDKLHE